MSVKFTSHVPNRKTTPQSEPIPGEKQVQNNAGGYVYETSKWDRLNRFLILGTDGGTYYVSEKKLTRDNAQVVESCLAEDYAKTIAQIVEISDKGRAPKNDQAIFALALAAANQRPEVRLLALSQLSKVCRIPTHLFKFMEYSKTLRGVSRGFRNAIARWYRDFSADKLAYELVKYQARDGWSHRDVLRQAHPKLPYDRQAALRWACGLPTGNRLVDRPKDSKLAPRVYGEAGKLPEIIEAFEHAKTASIPDLVTLIREYGLTREMVPTSALNSLEVWEALLEKMPLTAMIRSLGKMTAIGLLEPMKSGSKLVVESLSNTERLRKSRVHPLTILNALRVYQQGHGEKGNLSWSPVGQIVDALDSAFYASFENVEPTGKSIFIALDVSGSMASPIAGTGMSCCEASSALAMVTARVEKNCGVYRFNTGLQAIDITPRMRLDDVLKHTRNINGGGTDCALPMVYATQKGLEVDAFCVYTDSETWAGKIHPKQALRNYRTSLDREKVMQIIVGMEANEFSIADPADPLTLDVVGFDTMTPSAISEFIRG